MKIVFHQHTFLHHLLCHSNKSWSFGIQWEAFFPHGTLGLWNHIRSASDRLNRVASLTLGSAELQLTGQKGKQSLAGSLCSLLLLWTFTWAGQHPRRQDPTSKSRAVGLEAATLVSGAVGPLAKGACGRKGCRFLHMLSGFQGWVFFSFFWQDWLSEEIKTQFKGLFENREYPNFSDDIFSYS